MSALSRTAALRSARIIGAEPGELAGAAWSFAYFFFLLSGYYVLRPLRDEMGIAGGVQQLPWLFTGTFVAMLLAVPAFGALTARFRRRRFLPAVYYFFIVNILLFYLLFAAGMAPAYVARAFFIWTSVFNLFVISVFWSFMVDRYSSEQARRLFGFIAAGGSTGAIVGPLLTATLATRIGHVELLLVSALLLLAAVVCIHVLLRLPGQRREQPGAERELGGSIWAGINAVVRQPYLAGIAGFIFLYTMLATFLYFTQANLVRAAIEDSAQRTALFARIDLAVNALTIVTQLFVTHRVVRRLGVPLALAVIPLAMMVGFAALALAPLLTVLVMFQVVRRAGDYAITRPARELLFTVVGREAKYKAKNFLDTVVYRGGDALSGWSFAGLQALGLGLTGIAWIGVPVAALWTALALRLGARHERLRDESPDGSDRQPRSGGAYGASRVARESAGRRRCKEPRR